MTSYVTFYFSKKFKKVGIEDSSWLSPFDPLQPQNYPKKCNSVTIWKKPEFERNYWLHFWLQFLIRVQKNCNQLFLSSGYKLKIDGYNFKENHFVTVTSLKFNELIKKISRLQNYKFLALISEEKKIIRGKTS
jgi:hypothetical protein